MGFSSKNTTPGSADAARTPTSPSDNKFFAAVRSSLLGSGRSSGHDGKPRPWDSSRVGLGLVDAGFAETKSCNKSSSVSSDSRNTLRINISSPMSQLPALRDDALAAAPMSLPKDFGIARRPQALGSQGAESEFRRVSGSSLPLTKFTYQKPKTCSEGLSSDLNSALDSSGPFHGNANLFHASAGSACSLIGCLSPTAIEQSEDYTCVITHGPNPKTTHIFGDRVLECGGSNQTQDVRNEHRKEISPVCLVKPPEVSPTCAPDYFLSFCYSCNRKLREGKDIFMYRGDKAFCSSECRDQEMWIEEEIEKSTTSSSGFTGSFSDDDIFPDGMFVPL